MECVFFWEQKTGVCSVRFSGAENLQRQFYLHQKFYSLHLDDFIVLGSPSLELGFVPKLL